MLRRYLLAIILTSVVGAASRGGESVPLFFIANRGQVPAPVQFMVKGSGLTAYFLPGEADLDIAGSSLRMRFEGANPGHRLEGQDLLAGRANFLGGNQAQWTVDVPLYGSLTYRDLYRGIDM